MKKENAITRCVPVSIPLADRLRLDNPHLLDLVSITQKIQKGGNMTAMDEVSALEDLYQLTKDVFSASYAWEYWRQSVQ